MCTIAAPARAASIAASAICVGGDRDELAAAVVAPTPVTAQVMNASVFTGSTHAGSRRSG